MECNNFAVQPFMFFVFGREYDSCAMNEREVERERGGVGRGGVPEKGRK